MKRKKAGLEKRIFVSFFVISLLLVLFLTILQWIIAKNIIKQYENEKILKPLSFIKLAQTEFKEGSLDLLNSITDDKEIVNSILDLDSLKISKRITPYLSNPKAGHIVIYNHENDLIYGTEWDLIKKYVNKMFQLLYVNDFGSFIANFGNKLYQISYFSFYEDDEKEKFIGIVVNVESINRQSFHLEQYNEVVLIPNSEELRKDLFPDNFSNLVDNISNKIGKMIDEDKEESIFRLNTEIASGIYINYDLNGEPSAFFIIPFNRNFNQFVQQSILFFLIIILGITLIAIVLIGTWFKQTILHPIKEIRDRMQDVAKNPSIIEPIEIRYYGKIGDIVEKLENKYSGVLGDMIETFNMMNKALAEYSSSHKGYKFLVEHLNSGIFWLDSEFKIILCNPSFRELLEISETDKVLGVSLIEFLHFSPRILEKAKTEAITISSVRVKIKDKVKYLIFNVRPVEDKSGTRLVGSIADITKEVTERKARETLELELIKSNKLAEIGRRVEGIIHNLNSPLNSILGYAQLLKKEFSRHKDLEKILEAGKVISHYVKVLQTKIRKDDVYMTHPININELIEQELELCTHNLFFKHYVILEKNLDPELPEILAVFGDISLCVANLLNNAIESLKDSPEKYIRVRTYQTSELVAIEIEDTGSGIEEKNLDKIFEPYFTTKKHKDAIGFGLGLAIGKNITEKYNGRIEVKSIIGHGSTFTIFLPFGK